ncbi:epididymal-specific lipocalin-5-like isoform X2 [Tachyglossus aculeatus]|uniref:epididymal-specific lipocalin-5-like isoform X2 n=1 Tax=Tachyglossus aculeatus TaxID=9261 RepID=UPI0018F68A2C|nr:epididymal-specific lipocalin-5-like isoform X2 [Tachyglossus aculeatus]
MNVVLLSIILGLISESDAGEKIPIKLDFDISKFVGQWYFVGIGMKPGDDISDIINPVYVTPENCHLQVKFLIFKDGECVSYKFEARRTLIGGNFRLSEEKQLTVMDTDYSHTAIYMTIHRNRYEVRQYITYLSPCITQ